MEQIISTIKSIPPANLAAGITAAAAVAAAVIFYFLYRKNIKKFTKYLEEAVENNIFSSELYTDSYLKRHSAVVESIADKNESSGIIYLTRLDKIWINQLKTYPSEKMLKKSIKIYTAAESFHLFCSCP